MAEIPTLVMRALTKLAFRDTTDPSLAQLLPPTTLPDAAALQGIPRVGLSSFDPLYTTAAFEVRKALCFRAILC